MTRTERENKQVLDYIKKNGGFDSFWVGETVARARAVDRLSKSGRIAVIPRQFPWSDASICCGDERA